MKKLFSVIVSLVFALSVWAQSAEAILAKMEEAINQHEKEGVAMVVETKVPVVGTVRMKSLMLGDKVRMETKILGHQIIIWDDGETEYTLDAKKKELDIVKSSGVSAQDSGDMGMFSGITEEQVTFDISQYPDVKVNRKL